MSETTIPLLAGYILAGYILTGVFYLWHISDDGDTNMAGVFFVLPPLMLFWPIAFVIRKLRKAESK